MAKNVKVIALTEIQYDGEKRKPNSKPFDMDEEIANALSKKGIVKKVADTAKTQTEPKE